MSENKRALNEFEQDVLREVANIGTGHAVTALTELTGELFKMTVPALGLIAMSTCHHVIGNTEALAVSVYMPVEGDIEGHVAFIFPFSCACSLVDLLMGQPPGTTTELDEMGLSALMEVGNILNSSFLNALSSMTGLSLPGFPPGIAVDMTGAIMESLCAVSDNLGDHALTIMTCLQDVEHPIEGVFIFIPEPHSLDSLFTALGIAA